MRQDKIAEALRWVDDGHDSKPYSTRLAAAYRKERAMNKKLLNALKDAVGYWATNPDDPIAQDCRAVIAKAEGKL